MANVDVVIDPDVYVEFLRFAIGPHGKRRPWFTSPRPSRGRALQGRPVKGKRGR